MPWSFGTAADAEKSRSGHPQVAYGGFLGGLRQVFDVQVDQVSGMGMVGDAAVYWPRIPLWWSAAVSGFRASFSVTAWNATLVRGMRSFSLQFPLQALRHSHAPLRMRVHVVGASRHPRGCGWQCVCRSGLG